MAVKTPKLVVSSKADALVGAANGPYALDHTGTLMHHPKRARVKVGGVYVTGVKASAAQIKQSVARSADMLERLGHKIIQPGIQLKPARNVPLFSADPEHPGLFLRKLNGKTERGVLENGAFKVMD